AVAIGDALDRAATVGVGATVHAAIAATRRVVSTNTNLGIVLLLSPLAAVPPDSDLGRGIHAVLANTTLEDAEAVYSAIRLARPGGLGIVAEQDIASPPTVPLSAAMKLAAERDLIARQYVDGYREVLDEALPRLRGLLESGHTLETSIVGAYL